MITIIFYADFVLLADMYFNLALPVNIIIVMVLMADGQTAMQIKIYVSIQNSLLSIKYLSNSQVQFVWLM